MQLERGYVRGKGSGSLYSLNRKMDGQTLKGRKFSSYGPERNIKWVAPLFAKC